jgi:hypothetical protein
MKSWPQKAANVIGGGLFLTLFIVFVIQITARFFFNKPLAWTDEAAVILYVWVILWAAAVVVPEREHVVFDLVWNSMPYRGRQAMAIIGNLLVGGLAPGASRAAGTTCTSWPAKERPCWACPSMGFHAFCAAARRLAVRSAWAIWNAIRGKGLEAELRI